MSTKYVSGRLKELNVGISSYSDGRTSLSVIGNVGIGTDIPTNQVSISNTSILAVGILTAGRIFSTVFGEFTGGSVVADNIVGSALSISGISTLGNLKIENGALSAVSSGVGLTFTGDVIGNVSGIVTAANLSVTGLSTFTGDIDANGGLDVDGHTNLDEVLVTGIATFNNTLKVQGVLDANTGADISGGSGLTASTAKISDLTNNRIVVAGVSGELEDSSNLTFDGSTLAVTGDATFSGNVSIAGTLTKEDVTNIDSVGLITARSGVRVTNGGLTVVGTSTFSNDIDVDGHTELDNVNITGLSTISGNLFVTGVSTFAQSNFSGRIVGSATSNVIPFLYNNFSDLPPASDYHGAFAHVHSYGKAYYAHGGAWFELVNKEYDGTVGTGTERFNVGVTSFKDDVTFVTANGNNIFFDKSTNRLKFGNGVKLIMGDSGGSNLNIFHNQINTIIGQSGVPLIFDTDNTIFGSQSGDRQIEIKDGGSVDLYHNNALKLSTVGYGLSITGITSTTHLNVTGVSTFGTISSLNVSGLSTFNDDVNVGSAITLFSNSGIVSATAFYGSGIGLTEISASNIEGTIETINLPDPLPAISGQNLTNLNASNLASGTVPDGRFPAVLPSISGENLTNLPVVSSFWVLNDVGIHTIRDVGIGTTNPNAVVDVNNTNKLAVGILSAYQLYGDGRNLDRVSFGSTDGNYIGKNFTVSGGARGQANVILGRFAGCCHDGSNHNVYLGESAARKTTTGDNNVAIGCRAGCGNTDGASNIFVGTGAGCNSSTGSLNIFMGQQAGRGNTGDYNIALGYLSYTRNCGTKNVAIGYQAANDVGAGGTANVFIGEYAGKSAQDENGRGGQYNTYLGHGVGYSNPGDCNIGIGYNTLNGNPIYFNKNNIALGRCSGFSVATGSYNVFFGTNSGKNTTIGQYNFFGGYKAGEANVGGACNVYIGNQAGAASTTGEQNIAIGQKAGYNNKVGSYNLFFGTCAGYNNTCGVDNIFLGKSAGKANTTASCNTFIGAEAGFYTQTGNFNSFFGQRAGLSNVSGQCNTFIGRLAASNQTAGDTNVAIGYAVQLPSLTGSNQLVIGSGSTSWVSGDSSYNVTLAGIVTAYTSGIVSATKFCGDGSCLTGITASGGFSADDDANIFADNTCSGCNLDGTNGCHNILIGSCAGKEVTSGACNIFLGFDAGRCSQTNSASIYFGRNAGKSVCSGFFDVGIGDGNFCCSKHACANVAIGKNVFEVLNCGGGGAFAGMRNIGIGDEVGAALTTGRYNVLMGYNVARCLASDCKNIFIGCRTAFRTTSGCANIFIGEYAGKSDVLGCAGSNNIAIGNLAGLGVSATSDRNIFLGYGAGRYASAGCFNVAIGEHSGSYVTGNRNVFLGQYAGFNQCITGNQNVVIGDAICLPSASGSKQLAIGAGATNWIEGDSDYNVTFNGNINANGNIIGDGATDISGIGSIFIDNGKAIHNTDFPLTALTFNSSNISLNPEGTARITAFGPSYSEAVIISGNLRVNDATGISTFTGSLSVGGNLSVGGTVTYEDVTNVDSIGIITAREGIRVGAGKSIGSDGAAVIYYGDGSNLTGITAEGTGAIGGLTIKNESGAVVGTAGSISSINFNGSKGVTVTATSGAAGTATVLISGGFLPDEQENLYAGTGAGTDSDADTCFNVAIGYSAGHTNCAGDYNVFLGYEAGNKLTTGACNVFIGKEAGKNMTTGSKNTFIGCAAGKNSQTGSQNVILGWGAATSAYITGGNNFISGYVAANGATSASNNQIIGSYAGHCLTQGDCNVFIGMNAGSRISTTCQNVFLGSYAGRCNTGTANISLGCNSLRASGGGFANIAIGPQAGSCNAGGSYNIYFGYCAGGNITSGGKNIAIGRCVELPSATGSCQLAIGDDTDRWIEGDSSFNVTLAGIATVTKATGVVEAIKFCGDGSCLTNVPGFSPDADGNLVAGVCAGCNIASGGENNVVLGTCAGKSLTTADGNVFIGCYAGATYSNEAVGRNVFIGRCAGQCAAINGSQIAFSNVAIGYQALQGKFGQGSGTCHSVAIGDNALRCSSTGRANTAIGEDAGSKTDTGSHNFFGGYKAGTNNTSGVGNVMIGRRAGKNISGEGNVILGAEAACTSFSSNSCTGHYNVIAGYYAANKITGGSSNIVLGFAAGCNMGSVSSNIYIGQSAGQCNTSGNANIFIGGYAGIGVTSGDYNIAIGKRAALSNGDNQLVIGCCSCNWIVGNANWNVGIGTTNPDLAVGVGNTAKLSVGIVSAYQLYGDGSNLTGISAGGFTPDSQENLYAGTGAGCCSDSDTCFNVAIGACAGLCLNEGDENVLLGTFAGMSVTSGGCNVFLGKCAGILDSTGCLNIAIGCGAMGADTVTGRRNIVFGQCAGYLMTSGQDNILMGLGAGCCMCRGDGNVVLGVQAGQKLNGATVSSNVILGYRAACGTAGGTNIGNNIFIGQYAAPSVTNDVTHNIIMGRRAGKCLTTGSANVFLGMYAGCRATGGCNIYFGCGAGGGSTNVTGTHNIAMGFQVTVPDATGSCQLAIGNGSDRWIVGNSDFNVGIGTQYPNNPVTSANTKKLSVGILSAYQLYGDGSNLTNLPSGGLGVDACINVITNNTCSGCNLDGSNASHQARDNVFIGCCAAASATYAHNSIMIGACAGKNVTTGGYNIFFGDNAGSTSTTGSKNLFIGRLTGCSVCGTSSENVFVGYRAGSSAQSSSRNIMLGVDIMTQGGSVGNDNILVGRSAVDANVCRTTGFARNIIVGHYAAYCASSSGCNVIIGNQAGYNITSGCSNIIFGKCAVYSTTTNFTGNYNFIAGCHAACRITSGSCNIVIGKGAAMAEQITGVHNITLGTFAGCRLTAGCRNIHFGQCSGMCSTGGEDNITIGTKAGLQLGGNTHNNVIIGCNAASGTGTLEHNIVIGYQAMVASTGAREANVIIGREAGCCLGNGWHNVLIGTCAGKNLGNACCNIAIGRHVQLPNASDKLQLAIGDGSNRWITGTCDFDVTLAGIATVYSATGIVSATKFCGDGSCLSGLAGFSPDAQGNLFAGTYAGEDLDGSSGVCNVFIGQDAGRNVTSGEHNILFGSMAGCSLLTTDQNIMIGKCAGRAAKGNDNIFLGTYAGCNAGCGGSGGAYNIAFGHLTMRKVTSGTHNMALGCNAGCNITTGSHNTIIGNDAGLGLQTVTNSVFIGREAGKCTACESNIFIGEYAGQCNTCAYNVAIGINALQGSSTPSNNNGRLNVAVGTYAGRGVTSGDDNVLIGNRAGCCLKSGSDNVYLGYGAGWSNSNGSGNDNIALGQEAARYIDSGDYNIFLGKYAGMCISSGGNNISQGCFAGKCITTASDNIFLGTQAGRGGGAITGGCNIIIGAYAGSNICTGCDNIFMGRWSGNSSQNSIGNVYIGTCAGTNNGYEDNFNTFVGYKAGRTQVGGCGNVIIGACIDQTPFICDAGGSANEGCQLVIGYSSNIWLSGNKDFNVGVGTTSAKTDFQVGSHYGVTGGIGTFTAAAGVAHTINEYTIASTDFKTAEYTIFANTGNKIQSQKLLVMQDGTTAYSQEYAVMSSDTQLVSAGANIASGVVKIEITPETGISGLTTFRFTRHTML